MEEREATREMYRPSKVFLGCSVANRAFLQWLPLVFCREVLWVSCSLGFVAEGERKSQGKASRSQSKGRPRKRVSETRTGHFWNRQRVTLTWGKGEGTTFVLFRASCLSMGVFFCFVGSCLIGGTK